MVNAALMKFRTQKRRPEQLIDELLPKFIEDGHEAAPRTRWEDSATNAERTETQQLIRELQRPYVSFVLQASMVGEQCGLQDLKERQA